MVITKTLKTRIYPNEEQAATIDRTIGACRFIYNHMLERCTKIYKRRGEHLSYYDMQNLLPLMKGYLPWLKECDSQALKYACRIIHNAFKSFFEKRTDYPKYHSRKHSKLSYTTTRGEVIYYDYENKRVKLPCLGWIDCSDNRPIKNVKFCQATVSKKNGKYFVSITYKYEKDVKPKSINENQAIGLDYKSDGLYVDSNNYCCDMPHYFRRSQKKLGKLQRQLSKKVGNKKNEKKSNNYLKLQRKINNLHEHIANQRLDYLHKESTRLANEYDAIFLEDIDMVSLSNKGLGNGKATLDNGFGMFREMLAYKMLYQGKVILKVDRMFPSSQMCSCCGYKNPEVKNLKIRHWTCPQCGAEHDRDENAAINIRDEGLRLLYSL